MLVHYREPNAVLHMFGYRIYGAATGHPPTDIPWELFRQYCSRKNFWDRPEGAEKRACGRPHQGLRPENILVQATYRARDLQRIFGRAFSPIAFKYDEIASLPNPTLIRLSHEMGINDYCLEDIESSKRHRRRLLLLINNKIRAASPCLNRQDKK